MIDIRYQINRVTDKIDRLANEADEAFGKPEPTHIEFRSDMQVDYVHHMGDDLTVVNSARVSMGNHHTELTDRDKGLIRRLIRDRHVSTLEHCALTVRVEVPIFVAREWMRHSSQSFNEISGRYAEFEPVFYTPDDDRPIVQAGKPMDYQRELGTITQHQRVAVDVAHATTVAYESYKSMLAEGVAKEVARNVLPVNLYTKFYATANLRSWLSFLDQRTHETALHEIREAAHKVQQILEQHYPETMQAWKEENH